MSIKIVILLAFVFSLLVTWAVRFGAKKQKVVDIPDTTRKLHAEPTALLGGLALFTSFWLCAGYFIFFKSVLGINLIQNSLGILFFGSLILLLVGIADEVRPFSPKKRLVLVVIVLLFAALEIPLKNITNPLGGKFVLPFFAGAVLVFGWLFITTMSVKLLDGVDGLASSVVGVGALVITCLTLSKQFYQPNVALVTVLFLIVILGFLVFNAPRASIFLGESGSLFIGFMIGGLSILAGSKIITALLVMAVPVLDVARVLMVRFKNKKPLMLGDRNHLHFVLIDRGWKEWHVLLFLVSVSALFGVAGLFLQSYQKILALIVIAIFFVVFSRRVTMGLGTV